MQRSVVGAGADAAHHALQSFTRGIWAVRRQTFINFITRSPGKWIGLGVHRL